MPLRRSAPFALSAVLAMLLAGCGSGEMSTAPVTGKVTYNGAPVPGGGLTFYPVAAEGGGGQDLGKPASGSIKPDGTYTLTTYEDGDGAVPGKHRVSFAPPPPPGATSGDEEAPAGAHVAAPPPSPFSGLKPKTEEVEVTDGDNVIDIELTK